MRPESGRVSEANSGCWQVRCSASRMKQSLVSQAALVSAQCFAQCGARITGQPRIEEACTARDSCVSDAQTRERAREVGFEWLRNPLC
jgi:hypothetical protein